MRLIDADKLIEYLKEENRQIVNDAKRHNISSDTVYGMQIAIQAFTNKVNHMPTAYDVDAVIRELKNHPNVFREMEGSYIPLENAVEVVRSGDGKGWWNE